MDKNWLASAFAAAIVVAIAHLLDRKRGQREPEKRGSEEIARKIGKRGFTSLMYAATVGDIPALAQDLATGIDVNEADEKGETALMYAARENELEVVEILLKAGANPNKASKDGITPAQVGKNQGPEMYALFDAVSAYNDLPVSEIKT